MHTDMHEIENSVLRTLQPVYLNLVIKVIKMADICISAVAYNENSVCFSLVFRSSGEEGLK